LAIKRYNRQGLSAALQLIFDLGPFSGKRKSNIDLLLKEIWSKTVKKKFSNLALKQKSVATPEI